jgi:hypothetical protein
MESPLTDYAAMTVIAQRFAEAGEDGEVNGGDLVELVAELLAATGRHEPDYSPGPPELPPAITIVDVAEREDSIYAFGKRSDGIAFANAVNVCSRGTPALVSGMPLSSGSDAGRLIAAQRGDVLEEFGLPYLAEEVRSGLDGAGVLSRLNERRQGGGEAAAVARSWIEEDRRD